MVSGGFLKDATRVSGKCLQGIKKASGGEKKVVLRLQRGCQNLAQVGTGENRPGHDRSGPIRQVMSGLWTGQVG